MSTSGSFPDEPTATSPRVAVVIPTHDRRAVALRAVASVLAQSFRDFELVVVDDASTDGTPDAIAGIGDPRVRVVVQPERGGANRARNRGVRETTAPIIAFLDSDDEFLPHKLAVVVATFGAEADLGTLLDSYAIVNVGGDPRRPEPLVNPALPDSAAFLAALFDSTRRATRVRKSASGISVRREVAVAAGLFDERLRRVQDMEFLARLAKTARCRTSAEILWRKHELPQRISYDGPGFIEASLAMLRRHPEYGARSSGFAADIVAYLWLSARRAQLRRVIADAALLRREYGAAGLARLIAAGAYARLARPGRGDRRAGTPAPPPVRRPGGSSW